MFTGWCPLAADWGNVAEIVGALATIVVGAFAIRISIAANKTNRNLADLEDQRDKEAKALRKMESTLILISLSRLIGNAYNALSTVDELLKDPAAAVTLTENTEAAAVLVKVIVGGKFEIPEVTRSRMHFLELGTAAKILRVEGSIDLFTNLLNSLSGRASADAAETVNIFKRTLTIASREALDIYNECQEAGRSAGLNVGNLPVN